MSGSNAPQNSPRAQAAIRWPRPDRAALSLIALWVIGLLVALALPALVVAPGAQTAPVGRIWLAFAVTAVGAALMLAAVLALYRRARDASVLTLGVVPAIAVITGGIILAVTKIYPSGGA